MSGQKKELERKKYLLFSFVERALNELEPEVFLRHLGSFPNVDEIKDSNGKTILQVAVEFGNVEAVRTLLSLGADGELANDKGESPLEISRSLKDRENGEEIYNLLSEQSRTVSTQETYHRRDEEENELDEYNDNVEDVKKKLNVENGERITKERLHYIYGHRIMHKFLSVGKFDVVDLLLDITEIPLCLSDTEGRTLADISWELRQYRYLVKLLEKDSEFPKNFEEAEIKETIDGATELKQLLKLREDLHNFIKGGRLDSVQEILTHLNSNAYMDVENRSALAVAQTEDKMEIYAYLLSIGADYKNHQEKSVNFPNAEQKEIVKRLLDKHCPRDPESHLHKIITIYKVVGERTEKVTKKLNEFFERMNRSNLLRPLLKVLEHGKYSMIFDVTSENTERICIEYVEEANERNYGLTFPGSKRCYFGAKHCCSSDPEKVDSVYRTVAHEICHLVACFLYENSGLPYEEYDEVNEEKYLKIVEELKVVKCDSDASTNEAHIRELTQVFIDEKRTYPPTAWPAEVIARCAEIIALYGDDIGETLMKQHLPKVFDFYVENFIPDCETFSEDAFIMKSYSSMYKTSKYYGCLSSEEREIIPFEGIPENFEDKLLRLNENDEFEERAEGGNYSKRNLEVFVLKTNNIHLCKLHVYQKMKQIHKFHVDRKCLFYEYGYFEKNFDKFCKGLQWEPFDDVIIVRENEETKNFEELVDRLRKIRGNKRKRVIFIVDEEFESNNVKLKGEILSYDWKNLSGELTGRLKMKKVIFQGKEIFFYELFGKHQDERIITPPLLAKIMSGTPIGDEGYAKSESFDEELFIERYLLRKRLENIRDQFESLKDYFFLTGIEVKELKSLGFQESQIKIVTKESCGLNEKARIILPVAMKDSKDIFNNFCDKNANEKAVHWIHFEKNEFYYLKSKGNAYQSLEFRGDKIHEDELVNSCIEREERVVLIADDPGSGKSTVLTKLSILVKNRDPSTWVSRLSFKELLSFYEETDDLNKDLEENNTEESLELILNTIHKGIQAEEDLLKVLIHQSIRVSIFLDGFDELPSELRSKAIQLIKELRKKTKVQIWVTSRTSQSDDLVIALETAPYNLKLWDQPEQCNYLCNLWRKSLSECSVSKLRDKILKIIETNAQEEEADVAPIQDFILQMNKLLETDEMESISSFKSALETVDFSKLSISLLNKALYTSEFDFLGIPLHVYMFGKLFYSNNFKLTDCSNSFILFSKFFHQKVDIFLIEKCGLNYGTEFGRRTAKREKKQIEEIHKNIAKYNIGFGSNGYASLRDEDYYPFVNEVGLVKAVDNDISFFHKTFEEQFFAASVFDDMNNKKCNGGLIGKIILECDLNNVKRFLDGALEGNMPETRVDQNFFIDFRLKDNFHKFVVSANEEDVPHCIRLWEYIVINFESEEDDSVIEEFISYSKNFLNDLNYWSYSRVAGLRVLMLFRERKWISKIFHFNDSFFGEVILSSFRKCSTNEMDVILNKIGEYVSVKCSCCESLNDGENMDLVTGKCLKKDLLDELFKKKDLHGRNMLFLASLNNDVSVFQKVLSFAQNLFGDKYRDLLFEEDIHKRNILHNITSKKPNYFRICEYLKCEFQSHSFKQIIHEEYHDRADLWETVRNSKEIKLTEDLKILRTLVGKELFINILFKENSFGMTILMFALRFGYVDKFFILLKEARETIDYDSDIERSTFLKWLQKADADRSNIVSIATVSLDSGSIEIFYEKFRKILNDDKCFCAVLFKGILLCHDFAYKFKTKYNTYSLIVLDYISELITDDQLFLNDLFKSHSTLDGENFISIAVHFLKLGNMRIFFDKIKSVVDSNQMRELYLEINDKERTILHYACLNYENGTLGIVLDEIIKAFECEEEKIKDIIMKSNTKGRTLLHLERIGMKSIEEHEKYHYYIGVENMKDLMFRLDFDGDTCLHRVRNRRRLDPIILTENILTISKWLGKDDFQKLILIKNEKGHNFYYYVKMICNESDLFELLKFFKETLSEESFQSLIG